MVKQLQLTDAYRSWYIFDIADIHEVWSIELVMAHRLKQYRTWLIIPAISPYELVIRHLQSDFIRLRCMY